MLTDVVLGKRLVTRASIQSWGEIYQSLMPVEIDGWRLTLFNNCETLDYCEYCRSSDGRIGTLELWQRDGADPVDLLSARDEQLERLLAVLRACKQKHVTIADSETVEKRSLSAVLNRHVV